MPKLFRENPVYIILPALLLVIGAVFFFAGKSESASEWEKEAAPASYPNLSIKAVTGHYNATSGKYYAWAVGKTTDATNMAVILSYDPDRSLWLAKEIEAGVDLYGVTYLYDGTNYKLWAVGGNTAQGGYVYSSTDNFLTWNKTTGLGANKPLYDVAFAFRDPAAPNFGDAYGWTSGNGQGIYMSNDSGSTWFFESAAPGGLDIFGIFALDKNNVWAVGHSGKICNRLSGNWACSQPLAGNPSLKDVYITSDTPPNYKIYAAIDSSRYGYYNGLAWSLVNTSLQGTATTMYGVSGVKDSNGDYYIWFAGDNGKIINAKNAARWYSQSTGISNNLKGITVINKTHAWAVGESSTILKISPGNVAGWGYVGADNCANVCVGTPGVPCPTDPVAQICNPVENAKRTYPLGWLSFNCANQAACDKTSFSYGVNVKKQREGVGLTLCPNDTLNSQDLDVGALSGYAWFGKEKDSGYDPYEKATDPTCTATCGANLCCTNNQTLVCPNNDWCKECLNNPASCYTTGWLSFSRDDTGTPPATPYNSFPLAIPCGKSIPSGTAEDYVIATFDYDNYAVQGWARFKIGQCSNALEKACFQNSECAPGNCQYNTQGRCRLNWGLKCKIINDCNISAPGKGTCVNNTCSGDTNVFCTSDSNCAVGSYGSCDQASGWVRLKSDISRRINNPTNYDGTNYKYTPCNACTVVDPGMDPDIFEDDNGDEYLTCKICSSTGLTYNNYICNKCGEKTGGALDMGNRCGTGRCSLNKNQVCVLRPASETASPNLKDSCNQRGLGVCEKVDNDYSKSCNFCSFCDPYGVSIDIKEGKWYGYAWSEDFGWIDMKRAGLYSSAWLKTEYSDIYSAASIGTTRTSKAPGYDVTGQPCNATYLILASDATGNVIQNFCSENYAPGQVNYRNVASSGQSDIDKNPWLVQGYRALEMPTNLKPITLLGKIKYDDLYANKFIEYNDNQSGVNPLLRSSAQPVLLDNKIYGFNKTSYTIDNDITFKSGSGATGSGAGTLLFNGDLTIKNNITVDELSTLQNIKNLPSPAFYVMGNLTIESQVTKIVGTFYVEGKIITETKVGEIDQQLVVKGLMIASSYSFNRTFKGTINVPQPAELITYDGRVQLNPPPGFKDLSKALPKFTESTP